MREGVLQPTHDAGGMVMVAVTVVAVMVMMLVLMDPMPVFDVQMRVRDRVLLPMLARVDGRCVRMAVLSLRCRHHAPATDTC